MTSYSPGFWARLFDLQLKRFMHAGLGSEHSNHHLLVISMSALQGFVADGSRKVA